MFNLFGDWDFGLLNTHLLYAEINTNYTSMSGSWVAKSLQWQLSHLITTRFPLRTRFIKQLLPNTYVSKLCKVSPYFKLQWRVAAAGGQWGHGWVGQTIGQQGTTMGVEQRMEGVLWERWCDGWQRAKQVVRGCWGHLWHILGATLLKRCIEFCDFETHNVEKNMEKCTETHDKIQGLQQSSILYYTSEEAVKINLLK